MRLDRPTTRATGAVASADGRAGRTHRRPRLWQLIAVVAAALLAVYYMVGADEQTVLYNAFAPMGALGAFAAAARPATVRRAAWALFGASLLVQWAGDLVWTALDAAGEVPYPSIADLLYLAGYTAMAIAIWWIATRRPLADRAALLDSLILATGACVVMWRLFLSRVIGADTTLEAAAVAIAYPAIDIGLAGLLARLLMGSQPRTFAFRALTLAVGAIFVSDVVYGIQALDGTYTGGIVDAGWMIGYVLMGLAGAHPSSVRLMELGQPASTLSRHRLAVLGGASLLAPVMGIAELLGGEAPDLPFFTACSIVLFLFVILRLDGAFTDVKRTLEVRHRLEDELRHQAFHDPLTGLGNRALFVERLAAAFSAGWSTVGVILLDLDEFKSVNDTLGHQAGDQLLVEVADRLRSAVGATDLAARLGGDEFAVLMTGGDPASAADTAHSVLQALRRPMEVERHLVFVDASAGVAVGHGTADVDDLLRDADIAMYLAKSQGKGRVETFQPTMRAEVLQRVQMRAELADALERGELVLHYQPIVSLDDGDVRSLEALARWDHPVRGLIPPADFIPLAEATGLIVPLGRWVLREACRQAAAWNRAGTGRVVGIAVNIAAAQLRHAAFIADVEQALRDAGLPPHLLTLELTESVVLELDAATRTLGQLKELGVHIAIDDFGTGYSSLGYLSALPIDVIKIDRSFVATLASHDSATAIASTIVAIGRTLAVQTIAEGIEEPEQLAALLALGCGFGQGFLFARPVSADEVTAILGRRAVARDAAA